MNAKRHQTLADTAYVKTLMEVLSANASLDFTMVLLLLALVSTVDSKTLN